IPGGVVMTELLRTLPVVGIDGVQYLYVARVVLFTKWAELHGHGLAPLRNGLLSCPRFYSPSPPGSHRFPSFYLSLSSPLVFPCFLAELTRSPAFLVSTCGRAKARVGQPGRTARWHRISRSTWSLASICRK